VARWRVDGQFFTKRGAPSMAYAFLVFWSAAWTVAGVYLTYRAFRPSTPESLKLMPNGVTYDSGVPPL